MTDITSTRSRHLVLVICSTGLLMVGLDATIVNIALPAIHRSLGSSLAGLQWTVDAYTLVLASLLMLAGSTADRVGRKRVFQLGLLVFSLGSLLCALAPTLGVLIAARVLQAIGASMLSPVAMSIIRNVFVDPAERARAIGVYAAMFGLSVALGPVLGGTLVGAVGWRAVFLVNVPVGALAVLATHRFVPSRVPSGRAWSRSGWPAPGDRRPGIAHVRDHRGARPRLGLDRHRDGTGRVGARLRHPHPVRASAARAPPGGALVPQRPVLRRQRDRRLRVRGARGVPVPEHALPAGRARALSVSRRPVHAADGRDGARSSRRSPAASSAPAARGRRCSQPASR